MRPGERRIRNGSSGIDTAGGLMPELLRLFFDLPEAKVLEIRNTALGLIAEGKTVMSATIGTTTGSKVFPMPPADALFEARAALRRIAPEKYGRRVRKTYASFSRPAGY